MATQTVEFPASTGRTLTAKLSALGSDTIVDSQSATEATNRKGTYSVAYTDAPAALYRLTVLDGSSVPAFVGFVTLTLTTATFQARDEPGGAAEIQSGLALEATAQSIHAKTTNLPSDPADASVIAGRFDTVDSAIAAISSSAGDGSVVVTEDYGGASTLRAVNSSGGGINNCTIRAYLTSNYSAGNTSAGFVVATVTTDVNGDWVTPMALDPGAYTLVYSSQNSFQTTTTTVTVS